MIGRGMGRDSRHAAGAGTEAGTEVVTGTPTGRGRCSGGLGMASMAAAIAASRSAVMSANRPLDERERKRFTYFSSLSPMAKKIMQDKEKIREKYGPEWARLPPAQQDEIIDRCLVGPRVSAPSDSGDPGDPGHFPGLRGPTGQKLVRFGDEVGTGGLGGSGKGGRGEGAGPYRGVGILEHPTPVLVQLCPLTSVCPWMSLSFCPVKADSTIGACREALSAWCVSVYKELRESEMARRDPEERKCLPG